MSNRFVIYKANVNLNSVGAPRVMTIGYMKDSLVVLDVDTSKMTDDIY